jgi:hypothetical protein
VINWLTDSIEYQKLFYQMNPDSAFMMVPEESGFKEIFIPKKTFKALPKF